LRFRRVALGLVLLGLIGFGGLSHPVDSQVTDGALLTAPDSPAGLPAPPAPAGLGRDHTVQHFMIPMTDGIHLNTRVATPTTSSGPWPVLLYRTPYNIELTNVDGIADAGYVLK
jgi:predicted acyl esterase